MSELDWDSIDSTASTSQEEDGPSRERLASFWWGAVGSALICLVLCLVWGWTARVRRDALWQFADVYSDAAPQSRVRFSQMFEFNEHATMLPGAVIVAMVPILFWRGSLLQRFALSIGFALPIMCVSSVQWSWWKRAHSPMIPGLLASCILAIPLLHLYSPLRTKGLRLLSSTMLLSIAICLGIIAMIQAPSGWDVLQLLLIFAGGVSWSLLRRNWGSIALLESGSSSESIERTSSKTLLEMMIIVSLGLAIFLVIARRNFDTRMLYFMGFSLLFGVSIVYGANFMINRRLGHAIPKWMSLRGVGPLVVFFFASLAMSLLLGTTFQFLSMNNQLFLPGMIGSASICALFLTCQLWLITSWLRFCGWTLGTSRKISPKLPIAASIGMGPRD
jgi:hypothetical protein